MLEQSNQTVPVHTQGRPFPWFCPNCRRKEVNSATISYQCQRLHNGQPITIIVSNLDVPKCAHCGELVFTYETEAQINHAFRAQIEALRNGVNSVGAGEKTGASEVTS